MAICFEQPANNLIAFLTRYPWITLYPINPISLQKFREVFVVSRAKDDGKDAEYLARAVPLTDDPALLESYALRVRLTVQELELVTRTIKLYDQKIAAVFAEHPDHEIFRNLPGAGPVFGPRLLTSFGTRREESPKATNVQRASGIAPVTKQSGQSKQVHRRYRCSVFFKQSIHEWAAETRFWSDWARAFYEMKRADGMNHHAAVRALAYKWLRVVWRCWQDRVVYEEAKYLAALKKHGSPVIAWLNKSRLQASPA